MDNEVKTCEVVVALPTLTKGYHYTGEYRKLVAGESCGVVGSFGAGIYTVTGSTADKHHVVEKERWFPVYGDTVWCLDHSLNVVKANYGLATSGGEPALTVFKTEAIAEIARSNIHALLTEADLNNL